MQEAEQRFFTDEEAEQILQRASAISASSGTINYERLLLTAAELGISQEAVELAQEQIAADNRELGYTTEFLLHQRQQFFANLTSYLFVNGFLVLTNIAAKQTWSIFPIVIWGVFLALHALAAFKTSGLLYKNAYSNWKGRKARSVTEVHTLAGEHEDPRRGQLLIGIHSIRRVQANKRQINS